MATATAPAPPTDKKPVRLQTVWGVGYRWEAAT